MTLRERPSQQASHMQETFLCTGTEAIKSTKPVAHPVPNPRRNAKHGCLERQSEEISGEKSKKSRCNTSQVGRQKFGGGLPHVVEGKRVWMVRVIEQEGRNWAFQLF